MGLFRSKSETYAEADIAADIERGLVARYLARVLERGDLPLRGLLGVLYWMNERRGFMSFTIDDELSALVATHYSGGFTYAEFDRLYRRERERLIASLRRAAEETPRPEPLASNIELLTRELGLPAAALKIVGLIACYSRYDQVQYLCDTLANVSGPVGRPIAMLVGEPARTVEAMIAPGGELAACGLLQVREIGRADRRLQRQVRHSLAGRLPASTGPSPISRRCRARCSAIRSKPRSICPTTTTSPRIATSSSA